MRSVLAKYGLIGMIHLESYWDQDELFAEVRSVFKDAMNDDPSFPFLFLVPTGGGSKSLTKPVLSSNFKWTPKQVAGKADSIIYILAEKDLKNEEAIKAGLSRTDVSSNISDDKPFNHQLQSDRNPRGYNQHDITTENSRNFEASTSSRGFPLSFAPSTSARTPHEQYINLIDDSSSEDDDVTLQTAIAASLTDLDQAVTTERESTTSETVSTLLKEHFSVSNPVSFDTDMANRISIRRNHIWKDAVRAISKPGFNPNRNVRVAFVGEEAVDEGGPSREFFTLVLQKMSEDGSILQGPEHSRFFVHNVQALANRKFYYAGLLVAISLANGGPSFNCLAEAVYEYFYHGLRCKITPDITLIPDIDIQESLQQIQNAKSTRELQDLLSQEACSFVSECGFLKPITNTVTGDIPAIVSAVFLQYVILKSTQELTQFMEGLDVLGIIQFVRHHPNTLKSLFAYNFIAEVTSEYLSELFRPNMSPQGHNQREDEEAVLLNWNDYLQDIAGQTDNSLVTPKKVLAFVTGATRPPPMGFPYKPSIKFIEDKTLCLPTASTCSLVLNLPLALTDYQQFCDTMNMCILNTVGFGQV